MNNVNLIGRLVSDPELSIDRSGRDVCFMQVEVPRRGVLGDLQPGVIYVDVTTHGSLAATCASQLQAGQRIGISGTLEREDSLDTRGPRRSRWEIHAYQVDVIDPPAPEA